MGNQQPKPKYISSITVKKLLDNEDDIKNIILINTLPADQQDFLILNTVQASAEVSVIDSCEDKYKDIIIYGKNCLDTLPDKKYEQLTDLGFHNVFIYRGGLFEWQLLQEIYGQKSFQTTSRERDILKFSH